MEKVWTLAIILSLKTPVSEASDQEPRHFIPVKLYYYEEGLSLINQALNRFWKLSEKPVFETVESMLGWRPNMLGRETWSLQCNPDDEFRVTCFQIACLTWAYGVLARPASTPPHFFRTEDHFLSKNCLQRLGAASAWIAPSLETACI